MLLHFKICQLYSNVIKSKIFIYLFFQIYTGGLISLYTGISAISLGFNILSLLTFTNKYQTYLCCSCGNKNKSSENANENTVPMIEKSKMIPTVPKNVPSIPINRKQDPIVPPNVNFSQENSKLL